MPAALTTRVGRQASCPCSPHVHRKRIHDGHERNRIWRRESIFCRESIFYDSWPSTCACNPASNFQRKKEKNSPARTNSRQWLPGNLEFFWCRLSNTVKVDAVNWSPSRSRTHGRALIVRLRRAQCLQQALGALSSLTRRDADVDLRRVPDYVFLALIFEFSSHFRALLHTICAHAVTATPR